MLEAPMLGGVWGRIFLGKPYPCNNCREAARTQGTSWHQWNDFTTMPGLLNSNFSS
jgi:hypothetical protein